MNDGQLMQLGDACVSMIDRDATELSAFGVDAAVRQYIVDKTQTFKDMTTDEEDAGDVMIKTEAKDKLKEQMKITISSIMVRVRAVFGEKSTVYLRFGTKNMHTMSDERFCRCGKRVVRVAKIYLAELASQGLTIAIINDLEALVDQFDQAIDTKEDAIIERGIAAEERVKLANELYKKISEVYDYGKNYWFTRSEAKYNDYLIYGK